MQPISDRKSSTAQILKASAIIGGSSTFSIVSGIVKSKVMAVLLGPEGIGLLGLLQSVLNTAGTVSGMGLAASGVRQIAEAKASGDTDYLAHTCIALWWSAVITGLLGALLLIILRQPITRLVIGADGYAGAITWLAAGVWATTVSGAQTAILNGLRYLGYLARVYILSALGGMLIAVLAVWQWREAGIAVAVVSTPLVLLVVSWHYTRRIVKIRIKATWQAVSKPLRGLFSLGFAFMITNLIRTATQFAVRVLITGTLGVTATGHFQAAWSISALYLGFILESMGKDFYPRLTAVADDRKTTNTLVNDQAELALLLGAPVILGMLTLTSQVVSILYSGVFGETVGILRWQFLGDLFKVASWTMGFLLLAQGRSRLFFTTELSWNLMYLGLVWGGLPIWNLKATGIAYFLTHTFYFFLLWIIIFRVNRFYWRKTNLILLIVLMGCAAIISWARLFPGIVPLVLGLTLTLAMGSYSCLRIYRLLGGWPWIYFKKRS